MAPVIVEQQILNFFAFVSALTKQPPYNLTFLHRRHQHCVYAHIFMLSQLFQILETLTRKKFHVGCENNFIRRRIFHCEIFELKILSGISR